MRLRFFGVLAMILGLMASLGASPALAQDDSEFIPEPKRSITIYNAYCEGEPADGAYFEECYNQSQWGSTFRIGVPNTEQITDYQTTDSSGHVTFQMDISAANAVRIIEDFPTNGVGWAAYCTSESGIVLPLTYVTDYAHLGVVDVDLSAAPEEDVFCDWYTAIDPWDFTPEPSDEPSEEPSAEPSLEPSVEPSVAPSAAPADPGTGGDTGTSPVVGLPNTGAGTTTESNAAGTFALIAVAMAALVAMVGLRIRQTA